MANWLHIIVTEVGVGDLRVLLSILVIFLAVSWFRNNRSRQMPPGPLANNIPIFGFLPFLGGTKPPYVVLTEMADKYGRIFKIKLGLKWMIVIADPKLMKEVFKREDVTNRPRSPLNDGLLDGYGISAAEGPLWRTQRRFAHQCLRDVGFIKSSHKNKIRFEENASLAIDFLIKELVDTNETPVDVERMVANTVANIFFAMVVSKTFDPYDAVLMRELDGIQDSFQLIDSISLANFIPVFCYLPRFYTVLKTLLKRREDSRNLFRKIIQEHRETLDPNSPRDIIDSFLIQMDNDQRDGVTSYFTEIQLLSMLADLFSAGTETTKTTLRWLLLALTRQPNIQDKVQKELDDVIGRNRMPTLSDRAQLPYLEATIQETLRISSIVAMGNPHCPTQDITVDGYHIPKGAMVIGLLWKFHRDSKEWMSPNEFNPDHFLNPDSKSHYENFMPFSTGRRICLGEDVARNELFLIASSLLQKFRFVNDGKADELPTLEENRGGFMRTPMSFKVKAVPRFIF